MIFNTSKSILKIIILYYPLNHIIRYLKRKIIRNLIKVYEDNVLYDYIDYDKYLKAYNRIKKYKNDLSVVDFIFIKRFKAELEEDFENILSVLRFCRSDLMAKHSHHIEDYINNKIEES